MAREKPFMAAYHPDAELAPRDVVARAIHAERAAGRGAVLDARTAVVITSPKRFPPSSQPVFRAGSIRELNPSPSCRPATIIWAASSLTPRALQRFLASSPLGSAPRQECMAPIAWRPILWWRRRFSAARAGRAAALTSQPLAKVLHRILIKPLPDAALQDLRQAMSREAGVLRDAEGLLRLLALIDRLDAAHGPWRLGVGPINRRLRPGPARKAAGGRFRSDYSGQYPARTLITLKGGVMESLAA